MRYRIERECWNENTFNGYEDRPYWRITLSGGNEYGLTDEGKLWSISNLLITDHTKVEIQKVIDECKLQITISKKEETIKSINEIEKISVKPKPIEKIIKEEESFKITGLHRFDDLDIKTLLRYERGVIPPNFYNKRKKK